jgi:hypothetical protein
MRQIAFGVFFLLVLLTGESSLGQGVRVGPDGRVSEQTLSLPYAFANESFGLAGAYAYGIVGHPQKQAMLLATAMAGSKGAAMGFLIGRDIQMPWIERLFFDPVLSAGYFNDNEAYIDGNPEYRNERAGNNDSDKDDFVEGDGWDNFFRLTFKYLLPVGHGKDQIISTYEIERGILKSGAAGGTSWNPLTSGKSYLELRPFYRWQQIDGDDIDEDIKTNGFDVSLFWDNRDFYANPSWGNSLRLKASRDFGWFDSSNSWTNVQAELDLYFPLKLSDKFRQAVLALDYWTSYSPTWDVRANGEISNRPPAYAGATLGGLWKLRGYPSQRFSDKAAVYYAAELRLTPEWNPFERWSWIQEYAGIEWVQLVPFAEIGRVAPEWNLDTLHTDMKWSLGLGLRAWAKGIVVRVDTAVSDEDLKVQMMVSQPFQF